MSCQRGNVNRARSQKHQNKTAFKNTLHDSSKRTKMINNVEIAEVRKNICFVVSLRKNVSFSKKPFSIQYSCKNEHITSCHNDVIFMCL